MLERWKKRSGQRRCYGRILHRAIKPTDQVSLHLERMALSILRYALARTVMVPGFRISVFRQVPRGLELLANPHEFLPSLRALVQEYRTLGLVLGCRLCQDL